MGRVLLVWEQGSNYGLLAPLRAIARELRERGHERIFAVRDLRATADMLGPGLGEIYQAPLVLAEQYVKPLLNYASLIYTQGFQHPAELAMLIRAWLTLMRKLDCSLVVANHSPIALIAAKLLGIPSCHIGTGFTLPPRMSPFPSMRPDEAVPEASLREHDQRALAVLNIALERLGYAPYADLQEIFRGHHNALLTYPEMDHYEVSREDVYLGVPDFAFGEAPTWPSSYGPRLFAYLRPTPRLDAVLETIKASHTAALIKVSGMQVDALRPYLRRGLTFSGRSIDFKQAAQECDVFVNYGAHGTACEFLLAGKPGLLLPDHRERQLVARRAVGMGAALEPERDEDLPGALRRLIEDPGPRAAAQAFAQRYQDQDRKAIVSRLVDEITVGM